MESFAQGREERTQFEVRWRAEWGNFSYAPEELLDMGNRILVIGRMQGGGPSSGAAVDIEWAYLATVAAGRVVHEQVFLEHAEALEAAGLSIRT